MRTLSIAGMLTRARLSSRTGSTLMDAMAVFAFTVSAWLSLTTAAGAWMFYQRQSVINQVFAPAMGNDGAAGNIYLALALIAVGLLTVPLLSLGAGAARLGAGARERRLAALRLLGMSTRQVVTLATLESVLQALVGFVLGLVVYLVSVPAWTALKFATVRIKASEMLLPWWLIGCVYLLLTLITVLSTFAGLERVSISPLGVAKRAIPTKVKVWRALILVAALAAILYQTSRVDPEHVERTILLTFAVMILIFVAAVALMGPLFLQVTLRPFVRTGSPAGLVALRRVVSDSRSAWRNINAIALMGLVATIASTLMRSTINPSLDAKVTSAINLVNADISLGVLIAFGFCLIIGATATLITQVSDIYDRAEEARSLVYIGTPISTLIRARFLQVMLPLVVSMVFMLLLGFLPAVVNQPKLINWSNMYALSIMIGLGFALTFAVLLVTIPLQRRIASSRVRRND